MGDFADDVENQIDAEMSEPWEYEAKASPGKLEDK